MVLATTKQHKLSQISIEFHMTQSHLATRTLAESVYANMRKAMNSPSLTVIPSITSILTVSTSGSVKVRMNVHSAEHQ